MIKTVLHGLTGPIDGSTYSNVMIPMNGNDDEWIASIASFIRNNFGNQASFVSAADVARVRAKTKDRADFWTVDELESRGAQPDRAARRLEGDGQPQRRQRAARRRRPDAGWRSAGARAAPGRRARSSRPACG